MTFLNLILNAILLYMLIINSFASASTTEINFNFNSTTGWHYLRKAGDARDENGVLQLTGSSSQHYCGGATYNTSIQLVNGAGKAASFVTKFSLNINTGTTNLTKGKITGDGLAFYMAPYPHEPPAYYCDGESSNVTLLSIANDTHLHNSQNKLVAVEIDYRRGDWDPQFPHVGIDLNNLYSVAVHQYPLEIMTNGTVITVWVSYSASDQTLNVSWDYEPAAKTILSCKVNLAEIFSSTDMIVGFSAGTGISKEIHQILSWEFNSTTFGHKKSSPLLKILISIFCSIGGTLLVGGAGWFLIWKKKRQESGQYSHNYLALATSNFAEENKIGEGGFGPVYFGYLRDSCDEVAVKYLRLGSDQGLKEFKSEIDILSKLHHPNLVELFGWCEETGHLLLVYKYMPNGSLNSLLYDRHRLLMWPKRYEIVLNLADALYCLHVDNEINQNVIHRDIKPDNVLIDSCLTAKLSDFGLARLVDPKISAKSTRAAFSMGYGAPELFDDGGRTIPSTQSDIYSFGVVLLEIACGRKPIKADLPDPNLVDLVWKHYGRNELLKACDRRLISEYNALEREQIERVMIVGLWCAHPDPSQRPKIEQARKTLNFDDHCEVPDLPRTKPRSPNNLGIDAMQALCDETTQFDEIESLLDEKSTVNFGS